MDTIPSIYSLFKGNTAEAPNAPAFLITAGDRSIAISWSQFVRDVELIGCLIRKYMPPRSVIGVLGENSYEWITGHVACVFAGAIAMPIDPMLTPEEIAERLRFTNCKFVAYSSLYMDKALAVKAMTKGIGFGAFGSVDSDTYLGRAAAFMTKGEKSIFDTPPDEDAVCTMVFTSGTTSRPKGVQLTLRALGVFAESAMRSFPIAPGDHSLMMLPLHHIFGIAVAYLFLSHRVAMGVCPDHRRLFDAVQRFRCNHLFLVPALAEILAMKIAHRGKDTKEALGTKIEWIATGGAALPPKVYDAFAELHVPMFQVYGLTETCAFFSQEPFNAPKCGTVGMNALKEVEIRTADDGELLIRGPNVMNGYYKDPELTAKALEGGWFHTGDVGTIDDEGYVTIIGRKKRTIVLSSGKKIAPEELEDMMLKLPGIAEVIVRGEGESRVLTAEVYASAGEDLVKSQISAMNLKLPLYKRIREIVFRTEPFPRTSSGKIKI